MSPKRVLTLLARLNHSGYGHIEHPARSERSQSGVRANSNPIMHAAAAKALGTMSQPGHVRTFEARQASTSAKLYRSLCKFHVTSQPARRKERRWPLLPKWPARARHLKRLECNSKQVPPGVPPTRSQVMSHWYHEMGGCQRRDNARAAVSGRITSGAATHSGSAASASPYGVHAAVWQKGSAAALHALCMWEMKVDRAWPAWNRDTRTRGARWGTCTPPAAPSGRTVSYWYTAAGRRCVATRPASGPPLGRAGALPSQRLR
jgi:hypothetical protein